jgi:hypothetical protein
VGLSAFQISGGATITEVEVDEKLTARRAAQQGFNDCSFPTIAGDGHTASSAAISMHLKNLGSLENLCGRLSCCHSAAPVVANVMNQ